MVEDRHGSPPDEPPPPRRPVTDGGTDRERVGDGDGRPADEEDGTDRRRLIMYVLVIAFAVPLVVEGATFVGLVGPYVDGDGTAAPSPTSTPVGGLTEGGEFLDETDRSERVTTLELKSGSNAWTFTLSVRVENTGDLPYELRLGAVTTDADRQVEGSATTDRIPPGGTAIVSTQWALPEGDRPSTIAVTAVEYDGGERVLVEREVRVGPLPVEG